MSDEFTCRCGCGELVHDEDDFAPECAIDQAEYAYGDMIRSEERDSR